MKTLKSAFSVTLGLGTIENDILSQIDGGNFINIAVSRLSGRVHASLIVFNKNRAENTGEGEGARVRGACSTCGTRGKRGATVGAVFGLHLSPIPPDFLKNSALAWRP